MKFNPFCKFGAKRCKVLLRIKCLLFPEMLFVGQRRFDDSVFWIDPSFDIERWVKNRLPAIVIQLGKGLEFVVVAFGTLNRKPQQSGRCVLHDGLEGIISVRSYFVGISVAFARAILPVAKKVRCLQEFDDLRGYRLAGNKFGQVVTSDLFD